MCCLIDLLRRNFFKACLVITKCVGFVLPFLKFKLLGSSPYFRLFKTVNSKQMFNINFASDSI